MNEKKYNIVEYLDFLDRQNTELQKRENVGSKLQYELVDMGAQVQYQDELIRNRMHYYWDNYTRREVCLMDPIGEKLTLGYMREILMKYPKFCENDEVQTNYIMEDVRKAIQYLNLKEALIEIGFNIIVSGWCLVLWDLDVDPASTEAQLIAKTFGWDECHPRFWTRFQQPGLENKIYKYRAVYVPYPEGRLAAHYGMKMERYTLFPTMPNFQHLTRIHFNRGLGHARIRPIWDAITKLRERSDSEHFRASNFMEARYPPAWKNTGKAKEFIDNARRADRTKGLAVEEYINPKSQEPTGLPTVTYRPWSQGSEGGKFDINKAAMFLDNEWARLLCNLGYSQVWAVGTQAGQTEGSEINLTRDDRADIAEFATFVPILKKILKKLAELGLFNSLGVNQESINRLLDEDYQIVCWKTWEYNDKMTLQQAQLEHQMEMERGSEDERNAYDQERENHNRLVQENLIEAIRTNTNMPMTPVMSSWVRQIGAYKGHLMVQYHDTPEIFGYSYPQEGDEAYQKYMELAESGSKGGWIWDNILMRPSEYGLESGSMFMGEDDEGIHPMFTRGTKVKHRTPPGRPARFTYTPEEIRSEYGARYSPEQEREFKMKGEMETGTPGLETSRKPFYIKPSWESTYEKTGEIMEQQREAREKQRSAPAGGGAFRLFRPRRQTVPQLTDLSRKRFNEVVSKLGMETFGVRTIDKIKDLLRKVERYNEIHQLRYNNMSLGNPMAFDIPLFYEIDDQIVIEYPCPDAWKKIENHTGQLWLYEDLGHGGEKISVGSYEYYGWDEKKNIPLAKFEYNEKLIEDFIKKQGKYNDSNIIKRLKEGLEPEMSTEYFCKTVNRDGKVYQVDFRNSKGEPRFEGIAIVEFGNCPSDICLFERQNDYRENPFAGYKDFDDCVSKNQDKKDPQAYCGTIKRKVEG